jgi:hypothetical protein
LTISFCRYLLVAIALFWIPDVVILSTTPEVHGENLSFKDRCEVFIAGAFVYNTFTLTWVLQCILLWKLKQIKENLNLVTELRISAIGGIVNGILGAVGAFLNSPLLLLLDGILFLAFEIYASSIMPLRISESPRTVNTRGESSHLTSVNGEPRYGEVKNYQKYILHELGNDSRMYDQFKTALSREFAIENILFLEAVSKMEQEQFQTIKYMSHITKKFIASGCEFEINADSELKIKLVELLKREHEDKIEEMLEIIVKIAREIMKDLRFGALARFKRLNNIHTLAVSTAETTAVSILPPSPTFDQSHN